MRYLVGLVLCAAVLWVAWKRWFSGHIPGQPRQERRYEYDDEEEEEEDLGLDASDDPMFQPFSE